MTITGQHQFRIPLALAVLAVCGLALLSVSIGAYHLSIVDIIRGNESFNESMVFANSRIPRTIALILVGASTSVCGLIMQMISRNKFVSPSTSGTVESATLGILVVTMVAPAASMLSKMLVATAFSIAGTMIFVLILRSTPARSPLIVPLVGIMLGGVIGSIATFFAYRYDLLQSLAAWTGGDFSRVLKGRYELLWLSGILTVVAYVAADRFTVAGLGQSFSTNLGLNYRLVTAYGLGIVSVVTAVNVVTVGAVPFLGLIVPNIVSVALGDSVRRAVPFVAVGGAAFLLVCDIAGRTMRQPFEIPIAVISGVIGSFVFLVLLIREAPRGR